MSNTILQRVKIELGQYHMDNNQMVFDLPEENPLLEELILGATDTVKQVRNYPPSWTDEKIEEDIKTLATYIVRLTVYDYNKSGMDFENSHTESGITRQFQARAKVIGDMPTIAYCLI